METIHIDPNSPEGRLIKSIFFPEALTTEDKINRAVDDILDSIYESEMDIPPPQPGHQHVTVSCSKCQRYLGTTEILIEEVPEGGIWYQPCGTEGGC